MAGEECGINTQLHHTAMLATMQSEIKQLQALVHDLSSIRDTLMELKILNTQEVASNHRQEESNKEFAKTLSHINDSLINICIRVETLEKTDVEIDDDKNLAERAAEQFKTERFKSKLILIGVIFASILSLIGILIK